MASGKRKEDKNQSTKVPPWVPVSKDVAKLFPVDREFTELEALVSLQLNHNNENPVTVLGLAKSWGWTRKRVRTFLPRVGVDIVYPEDTARNKKQRGFLRPVKMGPLKVHKRGHINFIDFKDLQAKRDITGAIKGATIHEKEKEKKKHGVKDPRINIFQQWWKEKYQHKFHRDYIITNWAKFGGQIKSLFRLSLSFEDIQYMAMEFFLDNSQFLTGSENGNGAGHNIDMFVYMVGRNTYRKYLDPDFREKNQGHIIADPTEGQDIQKETGDGQIGLFRRPDAG